MIDGSTLVADPRKYVEMGDHMEQTFGEKQRRPIHKWEDQPESDILTFVTRNTSNYMQTIGTTNLAF